MRLLIINQHTSNHGDEAAGKALLRALSKGNSIQQIDILYNMRLVDNNKITVDSAQQINHYPPVDLPYYQKALILLSFVLPFPFIRVFLKFSRLKHELSLIENADIIVNAPSGVNIGPYKNWIYLWRLFIALKLNKPLAIYSISFGPIPDNKLFKCVSLYVLKNVKFLSLRDEKSQLYASERNLQYIPSIDTAFLDESYIAKEFPAELEHIRLKKYVVIVPNELYSWHPNYRRVSKTRIDGIYLDIMNHFINKGLDVILLPQLFGAQNDTKYFQKLQQRLPNRNNIHIINDDYDSDIQQIIINNAEFLVGARYHSIVFALRGCIPFFSLSYEHKMTYMLSSLSLDKCAIDLTEVLNRDSNTYLIDRIEVCYRYKASTRKELFAAKKRGSDIAKNTFCAFQIFLKTSLTK
jgi:colanic acid/amylovoran biosynthesis protein